MTTTRPPAWFSSAIATEARSTRIEIDGCAINALSWGDTAKPGLVLVHGAQHTPGGGASSRRR